MAEPTLSLTYFDFSGEVGLFLGWGRGADNGDQAWTTQKQAAINSIVASGQRQFYFPPPVQGVTDSTYEWSFLRPVVTLTLPDGQNSLVLPDDFGGFEGTITIAETGAFPQSVPLVNENAIRVRYSALPDATGWPQLAAERPLKGTTSTKGQKKDLFIWPVADRDYELSFAYYILPDRLTSAHPYAYGGAAHVETILESCLAIAEQRLDDAASVHTGKFMERLSASIGLDRRNKPQLMGYNGDRSDYRHRGRRDLHGWGGVVTLDGVEPS